MKYSIEISNSLRDFINKTVDSNFKFEREITKYIFYKIRANTAIKYLDIGTSNPFSSQ